MRGPRYSKKEMEVKRLIHNINERLRKANRQFGDTFITEKMSHLVNMFTAGSRAKLNTATGRIRETEENIRSIASGRQSIKNLQDIASQIDTQRIITEEIALQRGETEAQAQSVAIGLALRKRGHKELNSILNKVNKTYSIHKRMNEVLSALYERIPSEDVHAVVSEYPNEDITAPLAEYEALHGPLDIGNIRALWDFLTYMRDSNTSTPYDENTPYYKPQEKVATADDLLKQIREMKGR